VNGARAAAIATLIRWRRPLNVIVQLAAVAASNYAAFWLRFDGAIPESMQALIAQTLPWLVLIRGLMFLPIGLYSGLWRYTSIWDLWNLVAGVAGSSIVFSLFVQFGLRVGYVRSVYVMDAILLVLVLGGMRLARRIYREFGHVQRRGRVLIYGAGDAGAMIVRDIRHNPFYDYEPIGFVDDDPSKLGQRIHGVKVLGTRELLATIIRFKKPDVVLVAMPSAGVATTRSIVHALEPFKVRIHTLPNLGDILGGKVTVGQIRELSVEDLLERAPVGLEVAPARKLVSGKCVLVTGAGGSIGSESSRQIAALGPTKLVLVDRYENGLHDITTELELSSGVGRVDAVIGDVTDVDRMASVFAEHRPDVVFHAAAHKHVPLMELSACEAVKNNIGGTRVITQVAQRFGVERFVLVSSDKAVNPSSVMGATKRAAEFIVQVANRQGMGIFTSVRFGNVLGSNGSVVPRFLEQIKRGGPVTVTHPEMRRYFMLIPEAVHLVLRAAALAEGGDIFVLEMGDQIRVLDLARNLIRLSGFVPGEEIPIIFTGCRPGEKLVEELVGKDETTEQSAADRILRVKPTLPFDATWFASRLVHLEAAARAGDTKLVLERLGEIVPTYQPISANESERW